MSDPWLSPECLAELQSKGYVAIQSNRLEKVTSALKISPIETERGRFPLSEYVQSQLITQISAYLTKNAEDFLRVERFNPEEESWGVYEIQAECYLLRRRVKP